MPATPEPDEPWRSVLAKARALTGFSADDELVLQDASPSLRSLASEVAKTFYDVLYACEPAAAVFRNLDQNRSVREGTLREWFESVAAGRFDDRFWTWHWLVGLVHVQHHVEPVFVMSMFGRIQTVIVHKVFEIFEEASAERVIQAFLRLTNCLASLAIESYHHEFLHAVRESGLREPVLGRMISMEVQKKLRHYRGILGDHPHS